MKNIPPIGTSDLNCHRLRPITCFFVTLLFSSATVFGDQAGGDQFAVGQAVAGESAAKQSVSSPSDFAEMNAQGVNADSGVEKVSQVQAGRKKTDSRGDRLTKEAEKAAIDFAQKHHPAMASLVKRLRNRDSDAYSKAVRELSTDTVRLSRLEDRQPQRFQSELDLWKVDSEIRLQLARWTISGSDRIESSLRRLLAKRQGLRLQRLQAEQKRLKSRMAQIDELLDREQPELKEEVEREWMKLTRRLRPASDKTTVRKKANKDDTKSGGQKSTEGKPGKGKASTSEKPQNVDQALDKQRQ